MSAALSRQSETTDRQLAELVLFAEDAIIGADPDGRITVWNPGAERMYGYAESEVLGRTLAFLSPRSSAPGLSALFERVRAGEHVEAVGAMRRRKDGLELQIRSKMSPVLGDGGQIAGMVIVERDLIGLAQHTQAISQLQAAAESDAVVMETARRVALDILSSRTGVEALRHIAQAARTLAGARYAALGVAQSQGDGLAEFITVGLAPEAEARIGSRPRGAGVLGLLLRRRESLRLDNLGEHPHSAGFPPNHPPMTSFLGVPIWRGDEVLGSLYLTDKEGGGGFTEADEAAVQALGAYAAVAIHNLHLLTRQRGLVRGLIAGQEEERRAVAYELHDGLTQFVMASHAHMEAFRSAQDAGNAARARRELDQGLRYLHEAVVESRRLVNGLRSLALDDLGLAGAVEQLLAEERQRAGWSSVEYSSNIAGRRFERAVETAAYRIAQEAITNVRKHASTDRLAVSLHCSEAGDGLGARLDLLIRDWGKGFVPEEKTGDYAHFGLHSMAERVSVMGGSYSLDSAPGQGTEVRASFLLIESQIDDSGGGTV